MSSESPDVILYDVNGNTLAVQNATSIPASTPALMVAGTDGTNSRYFSLNTSGQLIITGSGSTGTPATGILTVQGNASGVAVPVSQSGTWTVAQTTASNLLAEVGGLGAAGSVPVGNPVLTGGTDGTNTRSILTDTSGRTIIIGAASSGSAVAGNPVLVGGVDGTATDARSLTVAVDRAAMTPGAATGIPIVGQSSGVGRIMRLDRMGNTPPGYQTLLAADPMEGSTVNSWLWTTSATTMTVTQTSGIMTLNAGAITTASTDAIITTTRQFEWLNETQLGCSFKALITQTTNAFNELGFGAPAGTTAIINNGAFFRIDTSGEIFAVTSFNGTETVSANLGTLVSTTYYLFSVWIEDGNARFIIESSSGVPLIDYNASLPVGTPDVISAVSHLPCFARVYTASSAAGAAPQTKIANFQAWQYGMNTSKSWEDQSAGRGRSGTINPTTFAQTASSMTAAPATETPSNTVGGYAALGGEYATALTVASENPLSVFAFTIPSPYSFYLTGLIFSTPVVTTAISVTGIPTIEWLGIANCASGDIATGGGQKFPLGISTTYSSATAAAGTTLAGSNLAWTPKVPILCLPGTILHIAYKVLITSAVTTAGVTRGSVYVDGFFE